MSHTELLQRENFVCYDGVHRLSPGDFSAAAEIRVLRGVAGKVDGAARTDILKAVAILTDRSG